MNNDSVLKRQMEAMGCRYLADDQERKVNGQEFIDSQFTIGGSAPARAKLPERVAASRR
jgi:hypothetical protein